MSMSNLEYYLAAANIAGFILCVINIRLRPRAENGQLNAVLILASLLGGTPGIFAAILIFDRKARKENMMTRVFGSCLLVIQIVIYLMLKGFHQENICFSFADFFRSGGAPAIYLTAINIVTFAAFGIDKLNAVTNRFRIRITVLLGLSFAGGAVGGLLAMHIFRHKTRKNYFAVGLPLMIFMQLTVIFYLMNLKFY